MNHEAVIIEVVGDQESPGFVFFANLPTLLSTKPENLSFVEKEPGEIFSGFLRNKMDNTRHRIIPTTKTGVRWSRRPGLLFLRKPDVNLLRQRVYAAFIPSTEGIRILRSLFKILAGKAIRIIDEEALSIGTVRIPAYSSKISLEDPLKNSP